MRIFSIGTRFDPRRYRSRSWAEKNQVTIGIGLWVPAIAALRIAAFPALAGWPALSLRAFAALALFFSWGFVWNSGPIFPPSEINSANRWKYLTLLGVLWLIILPIAWWFAVRALPK